MHLLETDTQNAKLIDKTFHINEIHPLSSFLYVSGYEMYSTTAKKWK